MVGCGETDEEVRETLADLRAAGVDIVTLGQYLRPTPKHAEVKRYVDPDTFDTYRHHAESLGFPFCASGPLVRSSYKAAETFVRSMLAPGDPEKADRLLKERLAESRAAAERLGGEDAAAEPKDDERVRGAVGGEAVADEQPGAAAGGAAALSLSERARQQAR